MMSREYTGKRVVFTAPRTIELQNKTIRKAEMGDSEIIIKTRWSLISPGTEGAIYTGENPNVNIPGAWGSYPFNSGYTNLSEVVACGPTVEGFSPGDYVFSARPHGAYYTVDAKGGFIVKLTPEQFRPESLFARLAEISMTAPLVSSRTLGATVLVYGLGVIGNLAAQLYALGGARVVGIDPIERRRNIATETGLRHTATSEADDIRRAMVEAGFDDFADICVDAVGKPDTIVSSAAFARRGGEFVLLGSPKSGSTCDTYPFFRATHDNRTVIGAHEGAFPQSEQHGGVSRLRNAAEAIRLIQEGRLALGPLLTHVLPFDQAKSAFDGLIDRPEEYLGVAFDWARAEDRDG